VGYRQRNFKKRICGDRIVPATAIHFLGCGCFCTAEFEVSTYQVIRGMLCRPEPSALVLIARRTFESAVLTKLVQWASVSMEKSLNQPALPHAIIALNATDMAIDSNQWETQHSTDKLLSDVRDAVRKIPMLQERAAQWQDKGRIINNTKDLLYCYYSSVTVIRIPVKGRYMLMDQQVGKLREEIVFRSNQSHYTKARIRMLSNGDDLQMYLQAAFDHFAQDLDTPFNFVEVALRSNPIPLNFSGNILKLAIAIRDHPAKPLPPVIFKLLAPMVASCIMLDIHRHRRLGQSSLLSYHPSMLSTRPALFLNLL
jgi:hypothetical protein